MDALSYRRGSEVRLQHLSVHGLNFAATNNSASRGTMFSGHLSQHLVLRKPEEKLVQTGLEREFGGYTFSCKMPADGKILHVIERYPPTVGADGIGKNPETVVIYEREEDNVIDCFTVTDFFSLHQTFGFQYQPRSALNRIKPGEYIAKDTVFKDSPGVSENGIYTYGTNLNMALMSMPGTAEDGAIVSESALKKFSTMIYETRAVEFGETHFPLNMYGATGDQYKAFPDIGDLVREDGLLMVLREYDPFLTPVDMSRRGTMEPDYNFDRPVYVRGGVGRVIDVRVNMSNKTRRNLPVEFTGQVSKYYQANVRFHRKIVETYQKMAADYKRKHAHAAQLPVSPKFSRIISESMAVIGHHSSNPGQIEFLYRKRPIDEYRISFTIEYEVRPTLGWKQSDQHGGKGVIVKIIPEDHMPVDSDGNRADIVMDPAATLSRMNLGRLYEPFFSGAVRDVTKKVREILGFPRDGVAHEVLKERVAELPPGVINEAYSYLLGFYLCVSKTQYDFFNERISDEEKVEHLAEVVKEGAKLRIGFDNERNLLEAVKLVQEQYPPVYGPVSYVGNSGVRCTTKQNVRIAPMNLMLLDKIADEWMSTPIGRHQQFGFLSRSSKTEKFAAPYRDTAVRFMGETETRIFVSYCGKACIAEMMDRSNSPFTQREMIYRIMTAEQPTNIKRLIDRAAIPFGATRPLQLVKHVFLVAGFCYVYVPETS